MRQPSATPAHPVQADPAELAEWCEAFDGLLAAYGAAQGKEQGRALLDALLAHARKRHVAWKPSGNTPYLNTITMDEQPPYPGDVDLEKKLSAILRVDGGMVEVLPVTGEFKRNAPLRLSLEHPLQAQEDRVLELKPSVHGWQVEADIDETHDWRLQLTPADTQWRLKGRLPRQQHATRLAPSVPAAE